jgi:glutamate racemase
VRADVDDPGIREKPIGVFDSGIGGLTVVRALTRRLPRENIIYFGDTARVPYGPKSPQVVREYAVQDVEVLMSRDVKMVVVACNTVSAVALDAVQKRAGVPVVGMIFPGSASAVEATRNRRVGIIGTTGTINSKAYANAIRQIDDTVSVFPAACPLFVPLAEEGWTRHRATDLIASEYLFPLKLEKIDTLILGCTHYPVLREAILAAVDPGVTLIDSGDAAAAEVERLLLANDLGNTRPERPNLQFLVSDIPSRFSEVGERFLGHRLGRVQRVSL